MAAAFVLFHPRVLLSRIWRATVTPLASIIGSGFLVLAPILVREYGHNALWVMGALCAVSYAIGAAIRWNIRVLDGDAGLLPLLTREAALERISSWALSLSYVISVCYYLTLFGAFSVSLTESNDVVSGKLVTSAILILIGAIGWTRGFQGLESSEILAVGVKLAVITGLLMGMIHYTIGLAHLGLLHQNIAHINWPSVRIAFGLLITVQGFETSRYLEEKYDARTRIRTMRYAQWLSALIYMTYIGLARVDFAGGTISQRETAVIQMTQQVAPVLPLLLVVAALAAQFSAAVADTNGCGGLVLEMSGGRLSSRLAYALLVTICLALTWAANVYQIISYASRAFALYYGLQCALATSLSGRASGLSPRTLGFALLSALSMLIAILGIPAE